MARGLETHRIGEREIVLARGKRVSGVREVEEEVLFRKRSQSQHLREKVNVPIGGAVTQHTLVELTRLVPPEMGVTIVTFPTSLPDESYNFYADIFTREASDGSETPTYHLGSHTIPEEGDAMLRLGVPFITGGNQIKARDELKRGEYDVTKSIVVMGTSAGASVQGELMPFNDEVVPGSNLVIGVSIEQHNLQRGRKERQQEVVQMTGLPSLGFDEDTYGIIRRSGRVDVGGKGKMTAVWKQNGHLGEIRLGNDWINFKALPSTHPFPYGR